MRIFKKRAILAGLVFATALIGCSQTEKVAVPTSSLPGGMTLVEESRPSKDGNEVKIPYAKYQLSNGLTVILSPDNSDPLVHVDVTYHVGSAREEVGKSGFAHFFEHMMFQGSQHVGDQEHFRIVTEAGGSLNGTTNRDRTNYYQTVPSNQLEKILWLEADRMGFLLEAVSQRKFEIQRDTVKNERAQNYDNRPYGLIWERMGEALYPEGHPYSWQTIGYVEDLDRVDVNDLKAFFLRWYGPNNAVITIGGDIDSKKTLEWVNQYFGSIPQGPAVEAAPKQPVTLEESKFITLEDRIQQPMLVIGWPTQYRGSDQQVSLDMLASALGSGANSELYQKLVKTRKAVDAGAFHDCAELACTFYVYAMGASGEQGQLDELYQEVMQVMADFEQQGVAHERLEQITGQAEASAVFALQSVRGKVTQLASNETFYNQPDRIQTELNKIRSTTKEDVDQAYQRFIANKPYVALSVVPRGQTDKAVKEATFVTPPRSLPEYTKVDENTLAYRQVQDNFDRSVMPEVSEGVSAQLPELYDFYFDNGIEVLGTANTETPTTAIQLYIPAGERQVTRGKEGLASLTASLVQEGSLERSLEELKAELDKLGSSISVSSASYSTIVSISALTANLEPTLEIVKEVLFTPALEQDDFDRLKQQMMEGVVYQQQKPTWLASQATRQVLYGDSIFARSNDGTLASIESLTLQDVEDFYARHYTPHGTQAIVVSDLSSREVRSQLSFLSEWQGEAAPLIQPEVLPKLGEQTIYLVDKPNAPQSIVRFVRQGLPFDATGEVYRTSLANFNLAGNFNSRLNQNLREDKGYTYGASGYFAANREVGAVVFNAQVRANTTIPSLVEMQKEMAEYSENGMTEQELEFMRLAVGQQDALKYETPSQKAGLLSSILIYGLDEDYLKQRNDIVSTISKQELNDLAKKWFDPQEYQIIVVGDANALKPQLEALNIPVVELEIVH
ncbi:insulinase family protein [Vibrio astriarenae]|uniref:Insulinase family protein n=1 Tax=Vibrio astriarenae TaxID=1481923 RepID=A0A7Z2T4Y5_9VIBR|nr:pitrilysin family protein [Vibrio astriarenae]QIA64238.1 insulinase family protein [Vibrio astriarenae]